eukprot:SAG22_NODE_3879_length_1485_cov_3.041847_4_plen_62_part_00
MPTNVVYYLLVLALAAEPQATQCTSHKSRGHGLVMHAVSCFQRLSEAVLVPSFSSPSREGR